MKVGIIDYGMGNLHSVTNALSYIGVKSIIASDVETLSGCDKLILPGVGAFKDAMKALQYQTLTDWVKSLPEKGIPLLGICLGMQLLFESSEEYGMTEGLSLLKGHIKKLEVPYKVPHMGWNELKVLKDTPLFKDLPEHPYVYFVHSYYLETDEDIVSATTDYGKEIQVAAQKGQIYALQFHPEKSGDVGLQILKNFASL